jgi:hypothetical protein
MLKERCIMDGNANWLVCWGTRQPLCVDARPNEVERKLGKGKKRQQNDAQKGEDKRGKERKGQT